MGGFCQRLAQRHHRRPARGEVSSRRSTSAPATRLNQALTRNADGIVERFHKTVLDEFYRVAFRKRIYGSIAELQADLDGWIRSYNEDGPHQGRWLRQDPDADLP